MEEGGQEVRPLVGGEVDRSKCSSDLCRGMADDRHRGEYSMQELQL